MIGRHTAQQSRRFSQRRGITLFRTRSKKKKVKQYYPEWFHAQKRVKQESFSLSCYKTDLPKVN
jgi:hypothetical protein